MEKLKTTKDELIKIASEMELMFVKLGQFGLYRTMHKMHEAVKEIGYEISDILEDKQHTIKIFDE